MEEPTYDPSRPMPALEVVYAHKLINCPGKTIVGLRVEFPPNGSTPPHRHGGASVSAYVVSGTLLNKMNEDPMKVVSAGGSWYEAPGCHHRISDNASPTEPATLMAVMVLDSESSSSATAAATSVTEDATQTAKANYQIVTSHHNFHEAESQRPNFDHNTPISTTKSPYPTWTYGQGVPDNNNSSSKTHHEIDPYAEDRPMVNNYRLLVSGIAPRPIGFISTVSGDGKTENLAPFSYFQVVDHDPPMFIVGFSSRPGAVKDTYRNLKETGECVINTVSEGMVEAVNATSIDAPYGVSEWEVSGLGKAPSSTVKAARVKESVFSVEGKVVDIKDFEAHKPGMSSPAVVLIQATRFWVQEGAADEEFSHIDLEKLRPVAQLGGVSYGRITSTFERPRKKWDDEVGKSEFLAGLERRNKGSL
ncbi:hypothetical protein CBS147343_9075 [Aspergillus niger]|nr:hypothetical protein CBS147371_7509 [Aspergillus niger]KAI2917984.1 hypothetical protein CBS147320_9050 [Aspergillus niger]KAI2986498.1 hypothetical protein CBS147344_5450 [Aspergillus niger]KAI3025532.1 hypothetical protein CBS147482_1119 [Aspergillus niger]KAI3061711.1 hypothetical protein CBS147343_9075 [Aspergillus niger]